MIGSANCGAETLDAADVADEARVKAGQQWLAKHDKECARQEALLYGKALEAASKNQLLVHEMSADIQANATLLEQAEDHHRAARDRLEDRMQARLARPEFNPYGKTVHCEHGLFQDADFNRLLLQHHMRAAHGDAPVNVFVVADLAHPRTAPACLAASPQFFRSGGSVGSAIAYTKALQTKRFLFVSNDFRSSHSDTFALLRRVMHGAACNWKFLDTVADWLRNQVARPKQAPTYWALLSEAEKAEHHALSNHKYALTHDMFLSLVCHVEHSRSALGIGISS